MSVSSAAAGFIFSRKSWVQPWLLKARPIAPMASTVGGRKVVCHKEGVDPCIGDAHYCECVHQRRRQPTGRLHNRTGEACPERNEGTMPTRTSSGTHLGEMRVMGREVVVAVTDGRLDFGTWERIFYAEFDGRRRKRVLVKIIGE